MNIKKLLAKGHLVPIYQATEDTIFLVGYRRKARSRKSHHRPFMLKAPIPLAKIPVDHASEAELPPQNPETSCNTESKK